MSARVLPEGPFAVAAERRQLRPIIEAMAAEMMATVTSHRPALAAWWVVAPTDRQAWAAAAWDAGRCLSGLTAGGVPLDEYLYSMLSAPRHDPGYVVRPAFALASYTACDLLGSAAAGDRGRFDAALARLDAEPVPADDLADQTYRWCNHTDHMVMKEQVVTNARRYREEVGLPVYGADCPAYAWAGTPYELSETAVLAMRFWEAALGQGGFDWPDRPGRWWPPRRHQADDEPMVVTVSEPVTEDTEPKPLPDGPFEPDGFRYAGREMRFQRAALRYRLILALWDAEQGRPAAPRTVDDVMTEVWGHDNQTTEAAFRILLTDTLGALQRNNLPLAFRHVRGFIELTPL